MMFESFTIPMHYLSTSLHQPYATLVACGLKPIETRKTRIHHRGPLLICATKTTDEEALERITGELTREQLEKVEAVGGFKLSGCMLALVDVVTCRPLLRSDYPRSWFYAPDRWAWELDRPCLVVPSAIRGKQGLYHTPRDLVRIAA